MAGLGWSMQAGHGLPLQSAYYLWSDRPIIQHPYNFMYSSPTTFQVIGLFRNRPTDGDLYVNEGEITEHRVPGIHRTKSSEAKYKHVCTNLQTSINCVKVCESTIN